MKPHSNGRGARKRTLTLSTGPMAVDTFIASNRCYWPRGPAKPANDHALTVYQLADEALSYVDLLMGRKR